MDRNDGPKGLRVLVVDDEKGLRDMLAFSLGRLGHRVTGVENGFQALQRAAEEDFDIVLSDIMMPGMSGLETLKALKSLHQRLPVIVVTGYATLEDAVQAVKLGASDYLAKPYELGTLRAAIERALAGRPADAGVPGPARGLELDLSVPCAPLEPRLPS